MPWPWQATAFCAAAASAAYLWHRRLAAVEVLLVDNGSLRGASTVSLRALASAVEARLRAARGAGAFRVTAASLRFSDRAPAGELAGGPPGETLVRAAARLAAAGGGGTGAQLLVVPAFIGPAESLRELVPPALVASGAARAGLAPALAATGDDRLARAALELARRAAAGLLAANGAGGGGGAPALAVCDHGSPSPRVGAARGLIVDQLRALLAAEAAAGAGAPAFAAVEGCAMERRPEPAYDFNEPMLGALLTSPPYASTAAVVAPLFLSPGRHAGPGGDIAAIVDEARAAAPRAIVTAELLGTHPIIADILADRALAASARMVAATPSALAALATEVWS